VSLEFFAALEHICDEYVKVGSAQEINIKGPTRNKILESVAGTLKKVWLVFVFLTLFPALLVFLQSLITPGTQYTHAYVQEKTMEPHLFDEAQNQIFLMISSNSWSAFLESDVEPPPHHPPTPLPTISSIPLNSPSFAGMLLRRIIRS
jgi:hypothetical protein